MATTKTSGKKQKHAKRKDRFRTDIDFGTPQVPLSNQQSKPKHELLSDWKDAP